MLQAFPVLKTAPIVATAWRACFVGRLSLAASTFGWPHAQFDRRSCFRKLGKHPVDKACQRVALDKHRLALLRDLIDAGAPPAMARLPMTPEEVAASYAAAEDDGPDDDGPDDETADDETADDERPDDPC